MHTEIPEDVYANLLRELKLKYVGKAQHIFHESNSHFLKGEILNLLEDQEHHFYVVIKGSIFFLLPLVSQEHKLNAPAGVDLATLGPMNSMRSVSDVNSQMTFSPEVLAAMGKV